VAGAVESERSTLQLEMDGVTPQVTYHKALETERKQHHSREEALGKITRTRVSWTRKLDELIDVINSGGDGEKYLIWLDGISVDQKENLRAKTFGKLKASGFSGSKDFAHVANFLEDIEQSPFLQDFHKPAPPEGSQNTKDEGLVPSEVWSFPLELDLKAPEERKRQ
jgi:hypothetical protein